MVTLRCTQKLLRRISGPVTETGGKPTTLLGDWHANIRFSKPQHLVIGISDRTLLPVIVPAKHIHTLPERFVMAVHEILTGLGVDPQMADTECGQMRDLHFGRTNNRRALGSLNDLIFHLDCYLQADPYASLPKLSLHLSTIIYKPIGYRSPKDVTLELFASGAARSVYRVCP
ncbi:MAG: hypothetical protein AB1558_03395 [Thermodesulfobacteriota bacterium]